MNKKKIYIIIIFRNDELDREVETMIPQTVGREFDVGRIAPVQCVKNDTLKDLEIKGHCFLMLIIHEGSAYFQVGDIAFEAIGPCFVCFDEREQPKLVRKRGLKCDAIYFHPIFLNINMTFERVHSGSYEQLALSHDMFLLKPFTDERRYVFPLFEEYTDISYRDKHPEIGSDIKLVGTRENNEYNLLVNMPFIADYISNYNDYIDKSKKIICEIKNMLKEKIGIECKIDFNPSDRENKPYLTSLGSAADTGDVGVVGRGNRINGLITPMRCMSIEAPAGKNPIDHTGKLYGILAHRLANEIFKITNCFVEIHIYVSKSTDIFKPEKIVINIDDRGVNFDDETIKRLVNDYFSSMNNLTKELVDEGICLW